MAATATLVVAGCADQIVDKQKLEKLLLIGLINSLGEEAPGLDAEFGQLSAASSGSPVHNEFGNCISNANSTATKHLIRLQFHPTAEQFRAALREAFAFALNTGRESESEPSVGGRVHVVYTGQVMFPTGEWLLDSSSVSGHQIHAWLDSEAAMSWWPQLNKYPNVGDKLSVHLVTPVAGPGSCWALDKPGHPQSILTHVDVRLVQLDLHIEASWRFGGKPVANNPANLESYDGIRNFVHQTIQHLPSITLDLTSEIPPLGCALSAQRPALYVFPGSGLGSQGCGLFSLQGFTMLLGGAYTMHTVPNWWRMVRNLPRLDVVLLPDWSAANLLTYRFLTQLPESHIIGELLLPPSASSNSGDATSELALTPPDGIQSNLSHAPWATNTIASENLPQSMVLYSKLGWGELRLQPLAQRSGLVLLWKSIAHQQNNGTHSAPLRIVFPATQLHGASPVQGLARLLKSLGTIGALEGAVGTGKVTVGAAKSGKPMPRPSNNQTSTRANGPVQTKLSGPPTRPQTAPRPERPAPAQQSATRKPTALASTPARRPLSATAGSTNATVLKRPASGTSTTKDPTTHSKTSSVTSTISRPMSNAPPMRPSPPNKISARPASSAKPSGANATKPQPPKTRPSTTADRLAAHANLVASKQVTGTRPSSAGMAKTKPTTLSKKPLAPSGKSSITKAKSPIREVSEPKTPIASQERPKPPMEPPTQVEPSAKANVLQESMELAAVDPLMSGWQSMEQSLVSGVPIGTIHNQIEEFQPQEEVEDKPHRQPIEEPKISGEVDNPIVIDSFSQRESQMAQPQDVYKVHKFEQFNEADEANLVEEIQDQESEDIVHDHTMSPPEQSLSPSQTDLVDQEVVPVYGKVMGEEEETFDETQSPHGNETERFDPMVDEQMTDLIQSHSPGDRPVHLQDNYYEDGKPNGMLTARSRPPAHLGFEDEEELEAEGLPISECEVPKTQSPVPTANTHTEFTEVQDGDRMGGMAGEEIHNVHQPYEHVSLTPGLADVTQESNELSDTGSFERHEEDAVAAVLESGVTGSPFAHISESNQKDNIISSIVDEPNIEKRVLLSDDLSSHDLQQVGVPQESNSTAQRETLSEREEKVGTESEDENMHQPELPKQTYIEEQNEMVTRDNVSFITSELHPASINYGQTEFDLEHAHGQDFMDETNVQSNREHDLEHIVHNVVAETEQQDTPSFHSYGQEFAENLEKHIHHQQDAQPSFDLSRHIDAQIVDHDLHQTREQDNHQLLEHQAQSPTEKANENFPFTGKIDEQISSIEKTVTSHDDQGTDEHWMTSEPEHLVDTVLGEPSSMTNKLQTNELSSPGVESVRESADLDDFTQSKPEDFSEIPGPQGDVAHTEEEQVSFEPDFTEIKMQESAHIADQAFAPDSHKSQEETAELESEVNECSTNQGISASPHTVISETHDFPHSQTITLPDISVHAEGEVSSTQPAVTSQSPTSSQYMEDDQSIEAQMRLKMLQEGEWTADTGLHYYRDEREIQYHDEQANLGREQQSSDVSDVDANETELWITNKNTVAHHALESPVSPSTQYVPTEDGDSHSPMGQPVIEHANLESDAQAEQGDQVTEPATHFNLDRPHSLITGSADSLEQFEPNRFTQFSTPPIVAADSTTTASGQAIPTSIQLTNEEPMASAGPEHAYEALRQSIPDSLEENDEVHPALSTAADSTTIDVEDHHESTVSGAKMPIGFDQFIYRSDVVEETVQHAVQPESPESHASTDSVVQQKQHVTQPTHEEDEVPSSPTEHTAYEQVEDHDPEAHHQEHHAAHPFEAADDGLADVQDQQHNGSHDVHTALTEHILQESFHGEAEPAASNHSEDVVTTKIDHGDIGFAGYGRQISENGTGHEFMHQLSDQSDAKLSNGVQSSGLPDSFSSEMQEHSNKNSHGYQPYPCASGEAVDSDVTLPSAARLKTIPGLPTEFGEHVPWNPTGETWPHTAGFSPDALNPEEAGLGTHGMPYPMHGVDFLAQPAGTNPFESSAELGNSPQVPVRQPSQPGHSPIVSPQTETFDPLQGWGQPQGLPTPTLPATAPRGMRTAKPPTRPAPPTRTSSASTTATRGKATSGSTASATLPPGPPVYMDLIWVPGYLVHVPQSIAVEFFNRVRARTYVLSGDALHPMVGEAMIEGKAKWGPNDVDLLRKQPGSDGQDNAICILPTDEPYEWGCWLRTPCGQVNRDTGEARLQASGFKVLPSASCCDIEFSAGSVDLRCEGVRVEF